MSESEQISLSPHSSAYGEKEPRNIKDKITEIRNNLNQLVGFDVRKGLTMTDEIMDLSKQLDALIVQYQYMQKDRM